MADYETKFLLANKRADGQCLDKYQSGWDNWFAFISSTCEESKPSQQIEFIREPDGNFSLKSTEDNYFVVTRQGLNCCTSPPDDVRALWINDRSNGGKHGFFKIYGTGKNSDKNGMDALKNGPVKIGSSYYTGERFHMQDADGWFGERLRNFTNSDSSGADNDAQTFISYNLLKECNKRGIQFDDCTKTLLDDCAAPVNQNFITADKCPAQYCTKQENVSKAECKTFCDTNKGICDSAAAEYCSKPENKDKEFCNCFGAFPETKYSNEIQNKGFTLRRICNLDTCVNNQKSYKTKDMLTQQCPSMNICIQGIETGDIGQQAAFSNVKFTCDQNTPLSPTKPYDSNMTADEEEQETKSKKKKNSGSVISPLYLVIGVVVVIFFLLFMIIRR